MLCGESTDFSLMLEKTKLMPGQDKLCWGTSFTIQIHSGTLLGKQINNIPLGK
jgi:hypothetical protein